MIVPAALLSLLLLSAGTAAAQSPAPAPCATWQDCRDQALAAQAAGDVERFHDFAWLAIRKGPRNDAALMTMLARAQSVSGRPHDALVMLTRLASMRVAVPDLGESDDFRRVRALPGWPELEARMAGAVVPEAAAEAAPKPAVPPPPEKPAARPAEAPAAPEPAPKPEPIVGNASDALRFRAEAFEAAGLAYDAVSKRFIVGNRNEHKIAVIGDRSTSLLTLAGADAGGFGEIDALAIDARQGDLWVASYAAIERRSRLHKLQLISGRRLLAMELPSAAGDARLTDLAVSPRGDIVALDSAGGRLFRVRAGAADIEQMAALDVDAAASLTISPDGALFVATAAGLVLVDGAGTARGVSAARGVELAALTGLTTIRWFNGSLAAVQPLPGGLHRIVRIRLAAGGQRATRIEVLETGLTLPSPGAIATAADGLFYLTTGRQLDGEEEVVIRRIAVK